MRNLIAVLRQTTTKLEEVIVTGKDENLILRSPFDAEAI